MTTGIALTVPTHAGQTEPTPGTTRPSLTGQCDDYALDEVMALLIEHADRLGFSYDRKRRSGAAARRSWNGCSRTPEAREASRAKARVAAEIHPNTGARETAHNS
jgi:hypothetical protein